MIVYSSLRWSLSVCALDSSVFEALFAVSQRHRNVRTERTDGRTLGRMDCPRRRNVVFLEIVSNDIMAYLCDGRRHSVGAP